MVFKILSSYIYKGNSVPQLVQVCSNCNLHTFLLLCFSAFLWLLYSLKTSKIQDASGGRQRF